MGVLVATVCAISPALGSWIERIVRAVTTSVAAVLSPIVLGAIYFLVLTPIAMFLRARGRDVLELESVRAEQPLERDPRAPSYFVPKRLPSDPQRAFRMS